MGFAAFLAIFGFGICFVLGIIFFLIWMWGFDVLNVEKHNRKRALQFRKQMDATGIQWRQPGDWVSKPRSKGNSKK